MLAAAFMGLNTGSPANVRDDDDRREHVMLEGPRAQLAYQ
jgi:hypothetical protein